MFNTLVCSCCENTTVYMFLVDVCLLIKQSIKRHNKALRSHQEKRRSFIINKSLTVSVSIIQISMMNPINRTQSISHQSTIIHGTMTLR